MARRRKVQKVVYYDDSGGFFGTGCGCLFWILFWCMVFFVFALVL